LADGSHLTYCTNIHAGESWAEVRENLACHVVEVKRRVCPTAPFGVGLRLSARAADELSRGGTLAELRAFLAANDLYVFTINGFPHGRFHGERVKERVYLPDWRDGERVRYTTTLADILAALLSDGIDGSVSTVPGAFRADVRSSDDVRAIAENLVRTAAHLVALRERTGRSIALALEPEPACQLETTAEAVAFFRDHLYADHAVARLARETGLPPDDAARALRRHLGVCFDTCHAAVEFEDAAEAVADLRAAGIPVAKVQLSVGLRIAHADAAARAALAPYLDPVYLHQVVARRGATLARYVDLPDALASDTLAPDTPASDGSPATSPEWRVHFHVPIFHERLGAFTSTRNFLARVLALHRQSPVSAHLEVETYTWDVLPPEARTADVDAAIARELDWVRSQLR
jgi:sugar phosphate isomerase/epimerase